MLLCTKLSVTDDALPRLCSDLRCGVYGTLANMKILGMSWNIMITLVSLFFWIQFYIPSMPMHGLFMRIEGLGFMSLAAS